MKDSVRAINSVSAREKFRSYLRHPGSLVLFLLVWLSPFCKLSDIVINHGFCLAVGCHKRLHIGITVIFQDFG